MCNLAFMYRDGLGTAANATEAMRWFGAASEMGNSEGTLSLGQGYLLGLGVSMDQAKGARLCHVAATQGPSIAALPSAE